MDLRLSGKVAVVTGASKGIGLAIARALAQEGASVVAGALHGSPELDALAHEFDVLPVQVDLSAVDGPAALITVAVERHQRLDILVNNVGGVRPRPDGFLSVTDDDWAWSMTLNFMAAVRTMRAALPHLTAQGESTIVTVSSVNAFLPDPAVLDYSAAKGALANLCKSLSKEYAAQGVRVNMVSPGPVQTDLWLADDGVAATIGRAQGKSPAEIAAGAADLVRPASSPRRRRSPTWYCCSPAGAPATRQAATSSSTAG